MADFDHLSDADKATFLGVVEKLRAYPPNDPLYVELEQAASQLVMTAKKRRQAARRRARQIADRSLDAETSTFRQPIDPPSAGLVGDSPGSRHVSRACYICKELYRDIDAHYHLLCPTCSDQNRAARVVTADLTGRIALVTGGRIKIGLHTALRLLRAGANVIVTSRFPVDAQHAFAAQPDSVDWAKRLTIVQADFLRNGDVSELVDFVQSRFAHLDILINNAAQTIARPPAYYRDVLAGERRGPSPQAASIHSHRSPEIAATANAMALGEIAEWPDLLPVGTLDETGQQLDLREQNSWGLQLHDIEPAEWLSCYVVGAFVPWLLIKSLRPMMLKSPFTERFVVNVLS